MAEVTILYFAWVREVVGTDAERFAIEASVVTVSDVADRLAARSFGHAAAFSDRSRLRVAVDQAMVDFAAPVAGAREIAFFPPVTGG
ncbi:MAG: molybdopterin converting factor subunit 1 [Sphingomonadaceae bacterium]